MLPDVARTTSAPDITALAQHAVVAGLFPDAKNASQAVHDLNAAAFTRDQIGVAMREHSKEKELIDETRTETVEAAASGAVGGGLLGAVAGYLIGIGAIALPGIGPIVAGGALASALGLAGGTALAGAGIGAAAGGFVGTLVGLGFPETHARHFETGLRSGAVLVMVKAGGRALEARQILERNGADLGPSR